MASVGTLRPVGLRRRLPWALGSLRSAIISIRHTSMNLTRTIVCAAISSIAFNACFASKIETTKKCGWLQNPTPGNVFLDTQDGTWWLTKQGEDESNGFDELPSFRPNQWRSNPVGYGYGCACISGKFSSQTMTLVHLISVQTKSLSKCRQILGLKEPS